MKILSQCPPHQYFPCTAMAPSLSLSSSSIAIKDNVSLVHEFEALKSLDNDTRHPLHRLLIVMPARQKARSLETADAIIAN